MKKTLLLLLLCLFISTGIMANEPEVIEIREEDKFLYERSSFNLQGFRARGAIGPKLGILYLNLDTLNDILAEEDSEFIGFNNRMIISGGSIVGGFREGPRFGVLTMNAEQEITDEESKVAKLKINYGGLLSEYAIYAGSRSDIALGAMIGGGNVSLEVRHQEAEDFESGINEPKGTIATKNFFAVKPRANFHYKITPYLALDLNTGYLITNNSNNQWDIMGTKVDDPTGNLSGPTLDFKINFGF